MELFKKQITQKGLGKINLGAIVQALDRKAESQFFADSEEAGGGFGFVHLVISGFVSGGPALYNARAVPRTAVYYAPEIGTARVRIYDCDGARGHIVTLHVTFKKCAMRFNK